MLMFKTDDEVEQIRHFISTYYRPFLSELEIEQLSNKKNEEEQKSFAIDKSRTNG